MFSSNLLVIFYYHTFLISSNRTQIYTKIFICVYLQITALLQSSMVSVSPFMALMFLPNKLASLLQTKCWSNAWSRHSKCH